MHRLEHDAIQIALQSRRLGQSGRLGLTQRFAWPGRIGFADDTHQLGVAACGDAVGLDAGEQFVKERSEGIDIGSRGDVFAAELLRTGVIGREQPDLAGLYRAELAGVRQQEFRNAEVE